MVLVAGNLQVWHYCPKVDDYTISDTTSGDINFDETPALVEVTCNECEKIHKVELKE